jgi:endonuclease/exonuclease/phosphatase family metal-dependent hydrolase
MHVGFNGPSGVWSSVSIPSTGGWQNWTTVNLSVSLSAGPQLLTLLFDTGSVNLRSITVIQQGGGGSGSGGGSGGSGGLTPFLGSPASIPGVVQAEDFDNGGEGVAYHDTSSGNAGGSYRSTDVDLAGASEGSHTVGWSAQGEWLNYTVNVASAGSYTVQLRVATVSSRTLHVGFNGPSSVWSAVSIPNTGSWQNWTTVSVPVTLGAGQQVMTLYWDTGGVNLNYVNVTSGSSGVSGGSPPPPPPPPPPPSGGSGPQISVVTWNVQVSDQLWHAQSAMNYLMNISPRPQVVVIEEAWQARFNDYIAALQQMTGQTWYGAFQTHCPPGAWNGWTCSTGWEQGVGIFSVFPIVNSQGTFFPFPDCWTSARGGLRAGINVSGTIVQVFAMHLQTGGCTNSAAARYNSMGMFKTWASQFSKPQIVAGDFNADADQIMSGQGMSPDFVDAWSVVGSGSGFTAFMPSPSMRIDYWMFDNSGRARPISSEIITNGGSVSDHRPVRTTFEITP